MKTWFVSDTHFSHVNVIKYCNRPFKDVEEMNQTMIARWNSKIQPDDLVYHLGDFAMGSKDQYQKIRNQLNGHIILILGNHDRSKSAMLSIGMKQVFKHLKINIGNFSVYLRHEPQEKSKWYDCDFHFCGHIHNLWARKENIINVGVDVSDFWPLSFEELLER